MSLMWSANDLTSINDVRCAVARVIATLLMGTKVTLSVKTGRGGEGEYDEDVMWLDSPWLGVVLMRTTNLQYREDH